MNHLIVLLVTSVLGQAVASAPAEGVGAAQSLRLDSWLVIGGIGRYGRSPIHTDAVEAQLVAGTWTPPKEGDRVIAPNGQSRAWESAAAGEDGWIRHAALDGGYAYVAAESGARRKVLLDASGCSLVYVNGQPRAGDPYGTGWIRHPIELRAGVNHLLFLCQRGRVRAELAAVDHPILFIPRDTTLPDLIEGEDSPVWGAAPVINATDTALCSLIIESSFAGGAVMRSIVPAIAPMSARKVGFRIAGAPPSGVDEVLVELRLLRSESDTAHFEELDTTRLTLRVRTPTQKHKRTFVSEIDGSVQYFAVTPMQADGNERGKAALVLTLHGAGVEALGQADAYARKSWAHIVAPTNRRPYGFDWEDWGRWDALEVWALAAKQLDADPRRTYLTGHSMGGHGVWHIGSLFPDRFAAIAPSAGWISFGTYSNVDRSGDTSPLERMVRRAASPSDTLSRAHNLAGTGIYILHGEKDDNVPVTESRAMRSLLGDFHADFAYYERPSAGHWWGNACVDWPPLFDFFEHHEIPAPGDIRHIAFTTSNPAVSATCHWAAIAAQIKPLEISSVELTAEPAQRRISGTTENVLRLAIDAAKIGFNRNGVSNDAGAPSQAAPLAVGLDGCEIENVPWGTSPIWFQRTGDVWQITPPPTRAHKGPHRYGPFKEAFNRRFMLVYGTQGTDEENSWAFAKARLDAETFWYRANGAVDVLADVDFKNDIESDRNVILYGNADSNATWKTLLSESPVRVSRAGIAIGERTLTGDDLACLFVRPRPGSEVALIGVVSGTGLKGMRLTCALPYFVSGVAYPDFIAMTPRILETGTTGIVATGFFGADWSVTNGDSAWSAP